MSASLTLGTDADGAPLGLPPATLLRHAMALGSSGSGKTAFCKVLVEEAVRHGIPAICVDPQGDLCSLGGGTLDAEALAARGVDPALADEVAERVEVVVFTPGSRVGIPLCADPVDPSLASLEGAARVDAVSRTAAVVVGRLGFDLDADDGAGLAAAIDRALHELLDAGARPSLAALTEHLAAAQEGGFAAYTRYLDARTLRTASQRLARLDVGARRALFHDGVPIDVDVLLGRDPRAPVAPGKVRVAVVYLNTLHQQEDKDFFVAALADRLYAWMLRHPSPDPQALFYIDEVAPFIPPVRKPACKDGLSLLFKQARKYGVGCLMATQNPGDVDYRAMAQFGTWALGRLTTRQDLKKVAPTLAALAPDDADEVMGRLPSLEPGQLVLLCPDALDAPAALRARWLVTRHETWNEARIEAFTDPLRPRFEALVEAAEADAREPGSSEDDVGAAAEPAEPSTLGHLMADDTVPDGPRSTAPEASAPELPPPSEPADPILAALEAVPSATVKELAAAAPRSEGATRRALARLAEEGAVGVFQDGRSKRYWARSTEGRPDLAGLPHPTPVIVAHVDAAAAARIAESHARAKVLGIVGEAERFERAEPMHRLIYKLDFEEKVERGLLGRLFGGAEDERLGSVYVHPHNLGVVVFENERGLRFVDVPQGPASAIRDFDGVTEVELVPPGRLALDDEDWRARTSVDAVRRSFEARFRATPGEVTPLFVPLFSLLLRNEAGSLRRVTIDAILGKPVRWLPPEGAAPR